MNLSNDNMNHLSNNLVYFANNQEELEFVKKAMEKDANGHIVNKEAWSLFYNQYKMFIFTIANKILRNKELAQDITHDVFIKCTKEFDRYNQAQPFKPWLGAIVKNLCLTEINKERSSQYIENIDANDHNNKDGVADIYVNIVDENAKPPYEYLLNKEKNKTIRKILSKLKPEFREVIELKYIEGMSYEEIAAKINKPTGTVMSRLFNAREKIRRIINTNKKQMLELIYR